MRALYLARTSPLPTNSGARLRVHSLWWALRQVAETRMVVLGDDVPLAVRQSAAGEAIQFLPARRERALARIRRQLAAFARGDSMMLAKAMSPKRRARITAAVTRFAPDVVILGDTLLATLIGDFKAAGFRVIVDTHNVVSLLFQRMARISGGAMGCWHWLYAQNAARMEHLMGAADQVWACSPDDAAFFRATYGWSNIWDVPNVLDMARFRGYAAAEEPGSVAFVGLFSYPPNEDAALRLIGASARLGAQGIDHRLYLIGRGATQRMRSAAAGHAQVEVVGEVEDVRPHVAKAAVFAAPLQAGSGTKFKILEALALGRAVVTTPVGAEGLAVENGRHLLVESTEAGLAEAIATLLGDPARRAAMGAAGRALVDATYSHEALARVVGEALAVLGPAARPLAAVG